MSRRQAITITLFVIVSLALAGPVQGGLQVGDPQELPGTAVGAVQEVLGESRDNMTGDEGGPSGDDLAGVGDALACPGPSYDPTGPSAPSRDDCRGDDGDGGSGDPQPPEEGPQDPHPWPPVDPDDELKKLQDEAEGATGAVVETKKRTSGILQTIWAPIQGVGNEAGRLVSDAYETATSTVVETTKTVWTTTSHGVEMATVLVTESASTLQDTVDDAMGVVFGLFRDATCFVDPAQCPTAGDGPDAGEEGTWGTSSGAVETPRQSPSLLALVVVSGLGLALAGLAALRRLLGLGGLTLLSRIPSGQIMKSGTRNAIHEIVRSDPGVSLNEIVDRMGLSRNAVAYHLAVFESEDLMTSVKDGKYRRYFLTGGRYVNGAKDVVAAIKNEKTLDVIRFITEHPGAIQKDVCAAVGTSPSATSWHIRRLERVGLVEKERVANMVQYRPGPNLERYDLSEFGLGARSTPATP